MILVLCCLLGAVTGALVCPPLCRGSNRSSVFLALSHDVAFRATVIKGVQTARVTGTGAEVDHLSQVLEVFKGGIYLKRVGKNTVHVFSGLGLEPGSECSVPLVDRETYLFAGQARRGSTPQQTALVDVNQCTLAVPWSSLNEEEIEWLRQSVSPKFTGQCPHRTTQIGAAPSCSHCDGMEECFTNAVDGGWCGPSPRAWCVPKIYTSDS